jgi:hypothetical protein
MFQTLKNRIQKANLEQPIKLTLEKNSRLVLWYNLYAQLYNQGIDIHGKKFHGYSPFTIAMKRIKGQPYNRVTLKDTGQLYASAKLIIGEKEASIRMERTSDEGDVAEKLRYHFGEYEGLTDESKKKLIKQLKPEIIKRFRETIKI